MAANRDPKKVFDSVQGFAKERDGLKQQNADLKAANNKLKAENDKLKAARNGLEVQNRILDAQNKALVIEVREAKNDYAQARNDHMFAVKMNTTMSQIIGVQSGKQVILWKYIWRLKNGYDAPHPDEDEFWQRMVRASYPMVPVPEGFEPSSEHTMGPVSEASEPSSEHSDVSTEGSKDSSETKLDPHAVSRVLDES